MRRNSRAFATVMAFALIAIVGAGLATLAVLFAGDVKRSVHQSEEAQLRQLLVAGEVVRRESLKRNETGPIVVALPEELQSAGLSLTLERIERTAADGIDARVTARGAQGRAISQTLLYEKTGAGWQVRSTGQ